MGCQGVPWAITPPTLALLAQAALLLVRGQTDTQTDRPRQRYDTIRDAILTMDLI